MADQRKYKTNKELKEAARRSYHSTWRKKGHGHGIGPGGSSTPGSVKDGCKASSIDKFMAKAGRSYKHPQYQTWRTAHSTELKFQRNTLSATQ